MSASVPDPDPMSRAVSPGRMTSAAKRVTHPGEGLDRGGGQLVKLFGGIAEGLACPEPGRKMELSLGIVATSVYIRRTAPKMTSR